MGSRAIRHEGTLRLKPGRCDEKLIGCVCFKGYLNNESATRSSITPDGWFKTGDVVVRDEEGFYTIVDRRKEMIKYKVRKLFQTMSRADPL